MLNEGYALYKSLERCGNIKENTFIRRHRDLTNPGKSDGLIIGINKRGQISSVEFRDKKEIMKLWTTTRGNHDSFPAIKLQRPIWNVGENNSIRKHLQGLDESKKKTFLLDQQLELNVTATELKWWFRLHGRVKELSQYFATENRDYVAFYDLLTRFQLVDDYNVFLSNFLTALTKSKNEVPCSFIETVLIGKRKEENKDEYRAEARIIFDIDDWSDKDKYSNRVVGTNIEPFISDCLFKMDALLKNNAISSISSLSGKSTILIDDKYPQITLPIGKTYLFSAAENIPCLERYGRIGTKRFPIGKDEADDISRSLKGITHSDKKDKTWCLIPSHKTGKKELLVVYLDDKPNFIVNQALLLGGESKSAFSESTYEAISSKAILALKGQQIQGANSLIRMFVLREADPGNKHVSLQRVYSISDLEEADNKWREAAKNVPNVAIPFFRKEIERETAKLPDISMLIRTFLDDNDKENKQIFISPFCPFPADLPLLTQKQWFQPREQDGKKQRDSSKVSGINMSDIYDVFFAKEYDKENMIEYILSITLQRTQPLLIGIGQANHKIGMEKFDTQKRFTVLKIISAIGIYLYKLGIKKENYMKDSFFYIGRFLSLIDTLHFEWCKHVRGGFPEKDENTWKKAIPPQLLGSAHLSIALDNPSSAFDILSKRLRPYKDWTRTEQSETVALARWAVGEIKNTTTLLAEKPNYLPSSTTSAERAQILLGYLAND